MAGPVEPILPESHGPIGALPGARTALAVLLGINLLNYADRSVLGAVMPQLSAEFFPPGAPGSEHSATYMGSLTTAFLISYMAIAPLFGWLADRMSRFIIIAIGVALFSLASGATGLAGAFGVLVLTRVFVGVGEAAYGPTAPTVIADLFPVRRRGAVLAWFYLAIPVGTAMGYILGGEVAKQFQSWRAPFYAVVAPGVALAVCCLFLKDAPRGAADSVKHERKLRWGDYKSLLKTPSYVLSCAGMTAMTFAIGGVYIWMPAYIHEYRLGRAHDDPTLADVNKLFGVIVVVAGIVGTLAGGVVADRWHKRNPGAYFLVSGLGMLAGFPFFLGVLYAPFPWVWFFMFMAIFCFLLGTGPANAILANVTHPAVRASAFAINILVIHALGDAISPVIMGGIMDATRKSPTDTLGNMNLAFFTVGVAVVVSGVLWILGARHLEQDTRLAPTRLAA